MMQGNSWLSLQGTKDRLTASSLCDACMVFLRAQYLSLGHAGVSIDWGCIRATDVLQLPCPPTICVWERSTNVCSSHLTLCTPLAA